MAQINPWRTLSLAEKAPTFLFNMRSGGDGYHIRLTDLSRIWNEKLDTKEIVDRAWNSGCSIDPSDDDQYQILLDKIESALNGGEGSVLNLAGAANSTDLTLSVSAPLPGSLPKLEWSMKLEKLPESAIGSEMVTPLLLQAYHLQHQIQDLIDEISSKDRVISKLTERWEAQRNDLAIVFPGVSNIKMSRKKSQTQRDQFATHVRGLADFDEEAWRRAVAQRDKVKDMSATILNLVLKDVSVPEATGSENTNEWWFSPAAHRPFTETSRIDDQAISSSGTANGSQELKNNDPSSQLGGKKDGGEHQRQTDSHQAENRPPTPATDDDVTDSGSERDSVENELHGQRRTERDRTPSTSSCQMKERSQMETHSSTSEAKHISVRKLGTLGGKFAKDFQRESSSTTPADSTVAPSEGESLSKLKPKLGGFGGKSKVEKVPSETSVSHSPASAKATPRLGGFGGNRQQDSLVARDTDPPEPRTTSSKQRKVGTLGGSQVRQVAVSPVVAEHDEKPHEAEEAPKEAKYEEQTVEETVEEKRQRLKRELGEKSKAPVKKKRRF